MLTTERALQKKIGKELRLAVKNGKNHKATDLSGDLTLTHFFNDRFLLIQLIRQGIPSALFNQIKQYTPFTENDWAKFLNISTKSLKRYQEGSYTFKPIQAEKIIELTEVTTIGIEVFGSMEKFKLWLSTPNYALGSLKPMELLNDSYGKEMIIGELTRINYGILV